MSPKGAVLGAHMSIAKGFVKALEQTVSVYGANAMQFFFKSPRGRGVTKLTDEEAAEFRARVKEVGPVFFVAHASYLLNLAKPLGKDPWALQSLVDDLKSMEKLGGAGVVLHIGKTLELPYEEAQAYLVENLKRALKETEGLKSPIILENTAGQGTEMGTTFEQLGELYKALGKPARVSFCLDTCHAFAAGYDLRTPDAVKKVFEEFDAEVGVKSLSVIHFNDSVREMGARRDRHEDLGEGKIGMEGLTAVARWAVAHEVPMILETPERVHSHPEDLERLRSRAIGYH